MAKRYKLIELRESKGLSQAELSAKAGMNRGYLSELEMGHKSPSLDMAVALGKALGVEIDPTGLFDKEEM